MPTKLEDINTVVRKWLNECLNIPLNKIIIGGQNTKLPAPPYIFLCLDDQLERLSYSEWAKDNTRYYESYFRTVVLIELIGLNPLTHSISSLLTSLEAYFFDFYDKGLGVVRDEIQVNAIPDYFEASNSIMKHIIELPIYFVERITKNRTVGEGIKFATEIVVDNGVADTPFGGSVLIQGDTGVSSGGLGGELNIQGEVSVPTFPIIETNTSIEGETGIPEEPYVEIDLDIEDTTSASSSIEFPEPPIIEITNITATGATLTCI